MLTYYLYLRLFRMRAFHSSRAVIFSLYIKFYTDILQLRNAQYSEASLPENGLITVAFRHWFQKMSLKLTPLGIIKINLTTSQKHDGIREVRNVAPAIFNQDVRLHTPAHTSIITCMTEPRYPFTRRPVGP